VCFHSLCLSWPESNDRPEVAIDNLKVQQELLRHADVRTTMNIYTQAVPNALREANSKVVRLVLPAQVA